MDLFLEKNSLRDKRERMGGCVFSLSCFTTNLLTQKSVTNMKFKICFKYEQLKDNWARDRERERERVKSSLPSPVSQQNKQTNFLLI